MSAPSHCSVCPSNNMQNKKDRVPEFPLDRRSSDSFKPTFRLGLGIPFVSSSESSSEDHDKARWEVPSRGQSFDDSEETVWVAGPACSGDCCLTVGTVPRKRFCGASRGRKCSP